MFSETFRSIFVELFRIYLLVLNNISVSIPTENIYWNIETVARAAGTLATPPVADEKGNNDSGYAASQLEDVAAPGSTPASPHQRPLPPAPPEEKTSQKVRLGPMVL